jgi:predicted metallopeptidase
MQGTFRRTGTELTQGRAVAPHLVSTAVCAAQVVRAAQATATYRLPPLELHWSDAGGPCPLPVRIIRPLLRHSSTPLPPLYDPELRHLPLSPGPFDFSSQMQRLCRDIITRLPHFARMDVQRILFCVTQARHARRTGLQARVTPMRCKHGHPTQRRRGRIYQVQHYHVAGIDMLYLMTFCLPRFQNQSFDDKLITVFHELHHINPDFNGDLRRHDGRYCLHTHSQKKHDQEMAGLVREYLSTGPDPAVYAFLRLTFDQLHERLGPVQGYVVPMPKLVPINI